MPAIADFLHRNESRILEFKQDLSSPERVLRAIVAFANTTGGTLVVGITDDRQPLGLPNAATEEERLANLRLSEEDFRNGVSRARNPVIAGVLHKLTIMENWGSGYERIETDARQLGYGLPIWEDKGSVLRARLLPHSELRISVGEEAVVTSDVTTDVTINVTTNERQEWFLQQIARGINVRPAGLSEKFRVAERTAKRDVAALQDAERIVFVGANKTGRYILLTKAE